MKTELICIACPTGCHLTVEKENNTVTVSGNKCAKGEKYAFEETTAPKRVVTYVVRSDSEHLPFIPVRTDNALPKEIIQNLIDELNRLKVSTPINRGEVLLTDFAATGVNIIATRTVKKLDS